MATKLNIELPDESFRALESIARDRGISYQDALSQVIQTEQYLRSKVDQGGKLVLEEDGGKKRSQITFKK